ncbi:hypothetical protein ACOALZ_00560 [Nocardiopsis algeriensis]|uniref:hypothetical protein n=1 Tax=Nocardiopsis algeriensis TaxID=1478215 RepID=UPI003B42EC0A
MAERAAAVVVLRFAEPIGFLCEKKSLPGGRAPSLWVDLLCSKVALDGVLDDSFREKFQRFFESFFAVFDSDDADYLEQALADMLMLVNEMLLLLKGESEIWAVVGLARDWVFWWAEGDLDEAEEMVSVEEDARLIWHDGRVSRVLSDVSAALEDGGNIYGFAEEARNDGREITSWLK